MLINLIANLNELDIFHIMLLGFDDNICNVLKCVGRSHVPCCAHTTMCV